MKEGIHPWPVGEIADLCKLSKTTFVETFAHQNTEEDMAAYLATHLSKEKLQDEVAKSSAAFYGYYVQGQAVAYLKVNQTEAQTEQVSFEGLEVERLYVLKGHKGKGLGKALMVYAEDLARSEGLEWIWLGVWEHNVAAISFYELGGFEPFGSHVFQLGSDAQTDILMRKRLE
jgi:GNAT superfamily N-acetyltransferase